MLSQYLLFCIQASFFRLSFIEIYFTKILIQPTPHSPVKRLLRKMRLWCYFLFGNHNTIALQKCWWAESSETPCLKTGLLQKLPQCKRPDSALRIFFNSINTFSIMLSSRYFSVIMNPKNVYFFILFIFWLGIGTLKQFPHRNKTCIVLLVLFFFFTAWFLENLSIKADLWICKQYPVPLFCIACVKTLTHLNRHTRMHTHTNTCTEQKKPCEWIHIFTRLLWCLLFRWDEYSGFLMLRCACNFL